MLLIADEIQSGLGRTGRTFACDHEGVVPDVYVLGKALGGGILALSAVVADDAVLGVFGPGSHGSTFGGNPLACAVGRAVLELLASGEPQANAARIGDRLRTALDAAAPAAIVRDALARTVVRARSRAAASRARGRRASCCSHRACWRRTRTSTRSGWRRR